VVGRINYNAVLVKAAVKIKYQVVGYMQLIQPGNLKARKFFKLSCPVVSN